MKKQGYEADAITAHQLTGLGLTIGDYKKLAEELGREPNLSEIAAKMQMSEDEVQAVMKEAINAVAVDRSEAAQKEDEALENQ